MKVDTKEKYKALQAKRKARSNRRKAHDYIDGIFSRRVRIGDGISPNHKARAVDISGCWKEREKPDTTMTVDLRGAQTQ
jgi:hypothetical protein